MNDLDRIMNTTTYANGELDQVITYMRKARANYDAVESLLGLSKTTMYSAAWRSHSRRRSGMWFVM